MRPALFFCVTLTWLGACNATSGDAPSTAPGAATATTQPSAVGAATTLPSVATAPDLPNAPLIAQAQEIRAISGSALIVSQDQSALNVALVSGRIGPAGSQFRFADTLYTLRDADGPDSQGRFSDGTVTLVTSAPGYQYVTRYGVDYAPAGRSEAGAGVFGIPTLGSDMPASGSAQYRGVGELSEIYATAGGPSIPVNRLGQSQIDVNFETGIVNAAIQMDGLSVLPTQLDRMSARGMILNGNGFAGTNVKMFLNGSRVFPTGPEPANAASGQFFGLERAGSGDTQPAEVGGVMHSSSSTGIVFGTFIAQ